MQFKGFEKNSLIEWPGKAVSIAYTGGCNFRCPFCQNKDLVLNPGELPSIGSEEILDHLNSRKKWLDGIMVTGGEPTIHPPLYHFAEKVKEKGLEFGIETNGSNPEMLKKLLEENILDRVALDIKAPLKWSKYKEATGTDDRELLEKLKKSMKVLRNSTISYEYRTTVVPKLLEEKDLIEIVAELRKTENYYLQQFVPENTLEEEFENVEPYTEEELKEIKGRFREQLNFKNCEIRNI